MRRAEYRQLHGREMLVSESDSEDDDTAMDPEAKLAQDFETVLKKRIFLADRFEKVEKALLQLNLISKETFFCSDFEFEMFKEEVGKPVTYIQISQIIFQDSEDVWFDLYRSITADKELAERMV